MKLSRFAWSTKLGVLVAGAGHLVSGSGCHSARADTGAPPPAVVVAPEIAGNLVKPEHPEAFPLVSAGRHEAPTTVSATGVVSSDVARAVPVVSMASGRIVSLRVRLGDRVSAGQLLLQIRSSDLAGAYADYRHAVADETLARAQLERARVLFEKGAVAQKDVEVVQDAEEKAVVDVQTSREHLRLVGGDPSHALTSIVEVRAPVSGVITEQNVTPAGGVKTPDNSPNLFTISDTSVVWIVCDVFENDLPRVHVGDSAQVHLNAYPDQVLTGRVDNILPVLDPTIRTAKVRVEVTNPGYLSIGMFASAVFRSRTTQVRAVVPSAAVLHLHDRDWVYAPDGLDTFRRVEVKSGEQLADGRQEVLSGLEPGRRIVANALALQNTVDQ